VLDKIKYDGYTLYYSVGFDERLIMKIAALIARYLLGLMFLVFGLNGFLHFLPQPPETGLALQYFVVLSTSHIMAAVFLLQLIGGVLLLANRFVPLALVLLGPVIVNILLFHVLIAPAGIPPGLVALILWLVVFYSVRSAFASVFAMQVNSPDPATGGSLDAARS
jgi:putative oxidoreductase